MSIPVTPTKRSELYRELLVAREESWRILKVIGEKIVVGTSQRDALKIAVEVMKENKIQRHWHPPFIALGANTPFFDPTEMDQDLRLQESDIFLVDLGPVWPNQMEGDVGQTFVVGDIAKESAKFFRLKSAGEQMFADAREKWLREKLSGQALYGWMNSRAKEAGFELPLNDAKGHQISDFPHKLRYPGKLSEKDSSIESHFWVLEVQLHDPILKRSAFYEDLLWE